MATASLENDRKVVCTPPRGIGLVLSLRPLRHCQALARGPGSDRTAVPLLINLLVIYRLFALSQAAIVDYVLPDEGILGP